MGSINRSVAKLRASANPWLTADRGVQKILNGILLLGFLLRVGVAFFTHLPHMDRDSYDYFHQADTLLAGGYVNYFPNGYPFIIALFKAIAGDHVVTLILSMNVLMSTLIIYFVYDIGRKIFQRASIGLVAAFIVAVLPTQLNYSRWVMTEIPTAFFLLGGYFFYYREKKWLSGLFLGIATIIRTDELPIFVLLILLAAIWEKKLNFRLLAGALIPILLVGSYCTMKTGNFSIAGHSRINIMYSITASGGYVDWYYQDKHPEITTTAQAEKMYIDHAKADPAGFVKQKLANLWEQWGFFPSSSNRGSASRLGIGLENVFMVIFGLYGWWKNRKIFAVFILILPFAIAVPLHVILLALPRYTYPVEPFLILLATWTLYHLFTRGVQRIGSDRVSAERA